MYVLTGIPGGDHPLQISGAELIRQLVLDNQVMLGSVNAARGHFQMAADDLAKAHLRWGTLIASLITQRYSKDQFAELMHDHKPDGLRKSLNGRSAGLTVFITVERSFRVLPHSICVTNGGSRSEM